MSVQTQIDRISGNVSAALAAIAEKGVTVPDGSNSDALHELILSIEAGGSASGFAKVATGTITPSNNPTSLTARHELGQAPDVAVVYLTTSSFPSSGVYFSIIKTGGHYYNFGKLSGSFSGYGATNPNSPLTSNSANFTAKLSSSATSYFIKGYTYRWIAGVYA